MKILLAKLVGLALTVSCWYWSLHLQHIETWGSILIVCLPLLQFPISLLGRLILDQQPTAQRSEWTSIFVHYGIMAVLGTAIFPAIQLIQQHPEKQVRLLMLVPDAFGNWLIAITGFSAFFAVINLAIRGLGAPFAAKLSSRLASDWMYAWTRNPMGLCTWAFLMAVGLRYRSGWFLVWIILVVTPGWLFFVKHYEERELEIRFGASYKEYRSRTPFLWPRKPRRISNKADQPAT